MPQQWIRYGAPAEAMAAFAEGFCPVHLVQLWPETICRPADEGPERVWVEAGRCDDCPADWHTGTYRGGTVLSVSWDQAG